MTQTVAILRTSIPMPPSEALLEAPIRWDIRGFAGLIRMATPLFSFATYRVWNSVSRSMPIIHINDIEISLNQLLRQWGENDESGYLIQEYFSEYHKRFKKLPYDLCDLVCDVSSPVDREEAITVLTTWARESMIADIFPTEKDLRGSADRLRAALALFMSHCMNIDSVVKLVRDINMINVTVKKKLNADLETKVEASPQRKYSQDMRKLATLPLDEFTKMFHS